MPAESADLDAAALAYADVVRRVSRGHPLDVVLIGIGEDGHLASLFPGHPGLRELSECFAVTDSPKPPPRRLTLSLPIIHAARARIVLCLGRAKGLVYTRANRGPNEDCPISLLPSAGTVWYLDDAAVAGSQA